MANIINYDAGRVFSGKDSGKLIPGWDAPLPHTPDVDPNYRFPTWASDVVVWLMHGMEPLYIFGPTGCGKTSCVLQIVTKLNYPVYNVTGHSRLEFPEMVGHHTVQQGNMQYELGPLALAMRDGGIFLLNEIDLLDPATAAGLNSVLDGHPLTIPEAGGIHIKAHPLFRFIATANSNGAGDQTGLYQGVLRQNIAFMDRFQLVEATYLDPAVEKQILQKSYPTLPEDVINRVIKFANAVRKLFIGEEAEGSDNTIELTASTRTLLRWCRLMVQFEPLKTRGISVHEYALERALLYRAAGPTKITLRELLQRIWG